MIFPLKYFTIEHSANYVNNVVFLRKIKQTKNLKLTKVLLENILQFSEKKLIKQFCNFLIKQLFYLILYQLLQASLQLDSFVMNKNA